MLLDAYLSTLLSDCTREDYRTTLVKFFSTEAVTLSQVRAVTAQDTSLWRTRLLAAGNQASTVNKKLTALRAFYDWLQATGQVHYNPADGALLRRLPASNSLRGKALTKPEARRVLAAVDEEPDLLRRARDRALLLLLIYGGLRRGEAATVAWRDFAQDGTAYVLHLPETKTGANQSIKVHVNAFEQLRRYRRLLMEFMASLWLPLPEYTFVNLSGYIGRPLKGGSINLIVQRYARQAGVQRRVTAHSLRRTCATLAIEGGASLQLVQVHLRHRKIDTTVRYVEERTWLADNGGDYVTGFEAPNGEL